MRLQRKCKDCGCGNICDHPPGGAHETGLSIGKRKRTKSVAQPGRRVYKNASTSGTGDSAETAVVAPSASTSARGASAKTAAAAPSASTIDRRVSAEIAAAAAVASIIDRNTSAEPVQKVTRVL